MTPELARQLHSLLREGEETERTVFFSDAVFAIAMTLLVLDLKVTERAPTEGLSHAIMEKWPDFLAFVLSFVLIAAVWVQHHRRFKAIERYDQTLQVLNLTLLLFVALIPMPTSLLFSQNDGSIAPQVVYASVLAGCFLTLDACWIYAWRAGLMTPQMSPEYYRRILWAGLPSGFLWLASIPLSFVWPEPALVLWGLGLPTSIILGRVLSPTRVKSPTASGETPALA